MRPTPKPLSSEERELLLIAEMQSSVAKNRKAYEEYRFRAMVYNNSDNP